MGISVKAKKIVEALGETTPKMGDLKKLAAEIKVDHNLAQEFWSTGDFHPRLLATLIFERKQLSEPAIEALAADMLQHQPPARDQLADWFMANQLAKDKKLSELMTTWQKHPSPILRRLFWYHQARLRWMGQTPPGNSAELMDALERDLAAEEPTVQWAMNFCAGQIGVHEPEYRARCIQLGEALGLYKDEKVSKGCTPSYLPEFIRIEVGKRS